MSASGAWVRLAPEPPLERFVCVDPPAPAKVPRAHVDEARAGVFRDGELVYALVRSGPRWRWVSVN